MAKDLRLLVVDDDPVIRALVTATLRGIGVQCVDQAVDGPQALDAARVADYDIVVMDYQMPGMTGIEATRALLSVSPRTRVVGYSARHESDTCRAFHDAGAVECFHKDQRRDLRDYVAAFQRDETP